MTRLKVLQISHSYEAPFLDVANFYTRLFDKEKFEVTSLFLKGDPISDKSLLVEGEKVIFLNVSTKDMRGLKLGLVKNISKLIKEEKYDIIIAQRYKAIYLTSLASFETPPFKFIGVIHAYNVFKNFARKLLIKSVKNKLTLLGVSDAIRDDIKHHLSSIGFHKIYSLPNCIPVQVLQESQYPKDKAREKLGIPKNAFVFGTAGRLHTEKGQKTLIKAFAQVHEKMSDATIYIMGKGRLKEDLQKLIDHLKLSDKVKLLGMVPEGPKYFKAFDVFVLPSMREPFGMVLIEAMAAELPIVSSESGGALEIIKNKNLLFEIGNIEECSEKLCEAYNWQPQQRAEITLDFNKDLNSKYSQEAFTKNFWELPIH
ncbi:MAG: glycosyltransferase [Lentisphaerales bacterium]|nr:glycosyltransferase [Lentisphaerales bacterium]